MNIECLKCKKSFSPGEGNLKLLKEAEEKGMNFLMLSCQNCGNSFPFNPETLKTVVDKANTPVRCPIYRCIGFASHVEEGDFYGCGECGSIWKERKDLSAEITNIIGRYIYRSKVYIKNGNYYRPVDMNKEPKDYEDIVSLE